jgi:two-component system, OmpR family, sensor histidine kinase KdpD
MVLLFCSSFKPSKVTSIFTRKIGKQWQYLLSVLSVIVVAAVGSLIADIAGYRVVALLLLVTVSLLAIFFDILPVLLAALLSALIWDFFFIPPYYTFSVSNTEDGLMLLMYFAVALINAVLTNRVRRAEKLALQKEEKERTIGLYNTLLNSLSHELRTPISTVIAASDNLLANANRLTEENKNELVEEISKASLRLNQQVENLLNMSRLESGFIQPKKDWCDINELLYSVAGKLEGNINNHSLKISVSDELPLFKLDFGLMEQAVYNILINAVQYTPEGTSILIDAHSSDYITKGNDGMETVASKLVLIITDQGSGFPQEEIGKVFDKFYRVQNSKRGGTGLGLSIAKGFVEAHNGTIRLQNWSGGGAEFTIEIPAEASYINALKNE